MEIDISALLDLGGYWIRRWNKLMDDTTAEKHKIFTNTMYRYTDIYNCIQIYSYTDIQIYTNTI